MTDNTQLTAALAKIEELEKQVEIERSRIVTETQTPQMLRIVGGALKNCIDHHGPITVEHIGSASKRIIKQFIATTDQQKAENAVLKRERDIYKRAVEHYAEKSHWRKIKPGFHESYFMPYGINGVVTSIDGYTVAQQATEDAEKIKR